MQVCDSLSLNKGNAVQVNFIIWELEITFWSNFKMPKSGKPQKRNLFTVAFLELQKYLLLNVGFKMFDRRKHPADCFMPVCFGTCWPVVSWFAAVLVPAGEGRSAFDAAPERLRWDRGTAQEPECLGSFPYIPTCFSCDLGQVSYALYKTIAPS